MGQTYVKELLWLSGFGKKVWLWTIQLRFQTDIVGIIVQEYVFYGFFEAAFKKCKKTEFKIRSFRLCWLFTTWNLQYSSKTMYVYNIYGLSSGIKDNKSDWVWYLGEQYMLLLLRFYVILKTQKSVTFTFFLLCFTRFLELWLASGGNRVKTVQCHTKVNYTDRPIQTLNTRVCNVIR